MHTILIATGYQPEMAPLLQHRPTPLLHIADRPILFHIIEFLASCQLSSYDLILHHLPEKIESELSDGRRWGVSFTYHLARDIDTPYSIVRLIANSHRHEPILLGRGDLLPTIPPELLKKPFLHPTIIVDRSGSWTGWAILPAEVLSSLPVDCDDQTLLDKLKGEVVIEKISPLLSTRSYEELKLSNQRFITRKDLPHLFPTTARLVEPGVWISRGVSLHPSAEITPPIFIGEACQIKANVSIGPNVIIESNSIVSDSSVVEDALICRSSFIGESLEIRNCIVDRNLLINLNLNAAVHVKEDFILSELSPPSIWQYPIQWLERSLALLLIILLSPIYLYMRLRFKLQEYFVVALPANPAEESWKTIPWMVFDNTRVDECHSLRHFGRLPALWNIFAGNSHFVGVAPRTIEEVKALPQEWRNLYLRSKIGLITLSELDNGPNPATDDLYASEVFYAVHMGWRFDLSLLMRWMSLKLFRLLGKSSY